jgi:catechol 2,3-dioxygenase-like lactoylglutathione lyase family enzyme
MLPPMEADAVHTLYRFSCFALWAALAASGSPAGLRAEEAAEAGSPSDGSLAVQLESAYVTDPSRWGKLLFDPAQIQAEGGPPGEARALATLIETYHRSWLSRDSEGAEALLDPEIARFRNGWAGFGLADVGRQMADESRGERPEGYPGSTQLALRDVQIRIDGNTATAFYRIDTHSGARWEYADLATVFQAFRKNSGRWFLLHHVESTKLGDPNAPPLPDHVPDRRTRFAFDFVYPAEDLQRAIAFYRPFLGEPEQVSAHRASFRFGDSRFQLEAKPFDERISIKKGAGNGYGVIHVDDLDVPREALKAAGVQEIDAPRPCGPDLCMIAEDPSGNVVVWRERRASVDSTPVRPKFSLEAGEGQGLPAELERVLRAWLETDRDGVVRHLSADARWVDDRMAAHPLSVASGRKEIGRALDARWAMLDRGPDGLAADIEIRKLRQRELGNKRIVTFDVELRCRGAHPSVEHVFVSQVWAESKGKSEIEESFMAVRNQPSDRLVGGMDYIAYPMHDLGRAGRFYKTVLGSEPYRDENWFGFWATSSVFGMFEKASETTPFRPYPHRNNGYADFTVRSADEVHRLLKESGAELPHVPGINDQAGIDPNPGYNQVLTIDTEGNLIKFNEYLEY